MVGVPAGRCARKGSICCSGTSYQVRLNGQIDLRAMSNIRFSTCRSGAADGSGELWRLSQPSSTGQATKELLIQASGPCVSAGIRKPRTPAIHIPGTEYRYMAATCTKPRKLTPSVSQAIPPLAVGRATRHYYYSTGNIGGHYSVIQ